ncbi:hypothetical protein [Mucilaginibacter sp. SG564]|uniref:hypothetical protein n=1 Tax=Mucilaginibacter sp. SG564 TaxID=2587022 RepID=UPI0020A6724D|nr:hypothetical protein [Mucilaginibacter sp. SG564]NOW95845.1 hypothetical protein [Mucilaginibacter sp. SG564]
MQLETSHAGDIIAMLEEAQDVGYTYTVFVSWLDMVELQPQHFLFFDTLGFAREHLEAKAANYQPPGPGQGYSITLRPVEQLLEEIKQANSFTNEKAMNYNNLENLKEELSKLGFGKKVQEDMQKQMEKGMADFTLHDRVQGNKGQVDLLLYFRQSGQSENYYLNKFDVRLLNGKPLAEGEKYMVVDPEKKQEGKPVVKSFDLASEAINYFKTEHNDAQLAVGKDWGNKTELARMEKGSVNYIHKDFNRTYKNPEVSQTFFVERGKGFTAEQAVNLIQGRAVFRDDLIKLGGEPYMAWNKLDMDSQKDRYQNFQMLQYHVPTFGFDLKETLGKFNIKELADEKKMESLVRSFEQGNRPLVTVIKDGQERQLFAEIQPRYRQLNFFREDGRPEKREQFLKEPEKENKQEVSKDKAQAKGQEQGMAI